MVSLLCMDVLLQDKPIDRQSDLLVTEHHHRSKWMWSAYPHFPTYLIACKHALETVSVDTGRDAYSEHHHNYLGHTFTSHTVSWYIVSRGAPHGEHVRLCNGAKSTDVGWERQRGRECVIGLIAAQSQRQSKVCTCSIVLCKSTGQSVMCIGSHAGREAVLSNQVMVWLIIWSAAEKTECLSPANCH